jgi:hypothetical protein
MPPNSRGNVRLIEVGWSGKISICPLEGPDAWQVRAPEFRGVRTTRDDTFGKKDRKQYQRIKGGKHAS